MNRKLKGILIAVVCLFAALLISCPTHIDYKEWLSDKNILRCDSEKCTTHSSEVNATGATRTNIKQVEESGTSSHTGWLFFMTAETYIQEKDRTIKVVGLFNTIIPYENKLKNGVQYSIDYLD